MIPCTEIQLILTTHTKNKSITMITVEPDGFQPALKNHVNLDHPHKNQFNRRRRKKSFSRPHANIMFISIYKLIPSNRPAHKTEGNFDPCTNNSSISIPPLNPRRFRICTPSGFRSRHRNLANFAPHSDIQSFSMP